MKRQQLIEFKFYKASLRAEGVIGIAGAIVLIEAVIQLPWSLAASHWLLP